MLKTTVPHGVALPAEERDVAAWSRKWFIIFLVVQFVVWTVIPMFRGSPHVDSLEAIRWGEYGGWGTDKHPPVSGWMALAMYSLIGNVDLSVYMLSQVCVLVAFIFFYKLALLYVPPDKALMSILFLEGVRYYSYYSTIYNVNMVSLMFVPVIVYMFRMAVTTDAMRYWLGTGLFGGLALLTKYNNGIVLFCLGLFLLITAEGRARMKRPGPYVALLTAVLLLVPHVVWLYRHDFKPFSYSSGVIMLRYDTLGAWGMGLWEKLKVEVASFAGAFILFFLTYFGVPREDRKERGKIGTFLVCAGILPYVITVSIIVLNRIVAHSQWPFALCGFIPLMLLVRFPFKVTDKIRRRALILGFLTMLLFAGVHFLFSATKNSPFFNLDRDEYAAFVRDEWKKISPESLAYVGGGWEYPRYAAAYMEEKPQMFYPIRSEVWIDKADVEKKGIMVLARFPEHLDVYKEYFPNLIDKGELQLPIRNWKGKEKLHRILYGVLPPASRAEAGTKLE